jgi:hypothetical protein
MKFPDYRKVRSPSGKRLRSLKAGALRHRLFDLIIHRKRSRQQRFNILYASTVADGKKSKLACVYAAKFIKK